MRITMRPIKTALRLATACFMATAMPQAALSQTGTDPKAGLISAAITPTEAAAIVGFWREAGPKLWFAKDPEFDHRFRTHFLVLHEAAARGELKDWTATAEGALALIILLDQFPRNAFRGTARMYDTDTLARAAADRAVASGQDQEIAGDLRLFVYLPFGHSESLADQERSVALSEHLGETVSRHARGHRDIIKRFGRFPHRNPLLGRAMSDEEQRFLDEGGFAG
jgi:uncharacterized protein (DUF924 family)